jgi:hypothetical protein
MKKLIAVTAVVTGLALTSGMALASTCPVLIKQGREAAAKMDANDPKVKQAVAKLDEAQKLHESGKHADSVTAAKEANAMLGVK